MTLHRHALSVLVLYVGGAVIVPARAEAMNIFVAKLDFQTTSDSFSVIVDGDSSGGVVSVALSVSSDAGKEDLLLTEADAWLHGSASLAALPAKDAALTLTLYDKGSASLMTFSGTLATDGTVTLSADDTTSDCEVRSKVGCTVVEAYDVEVLSAEVFASGKGYALTLDLAGADTYEVAYATVAVSGGDKAEVDWDAVGSVWEAESTLEHTGVIDVKAKSFDASGNTVENVKAELAEPWLDDGEGVNALSAGSGTSVAVNRVAREISWRANDEVLHGRWIASVVSNGWTTTSYPTHAELEVGGDTVTVPANSYQRTYTSKKLSFQGGSPIGRTFTIVAGGAKFADVSGAELASPVCSEGVCATLVEDRDGGYRLAFTTYGSIPSKLADKLAYSAWDTEDNVVDDLDDEIVAEESLSPDDGNITAVFASELEIDGDPNGGDASGSVSLLGAADKKGKQATLSKGTFYASFSRDSDGDLSLGGYGADESATSETTASALLGDPVECGGEGCDGDWAPPVIVYGVAGTGGKVTKIVVSSGGLGYDAF